MNFEVTMGSCSGTGVTCGGRGKGQGEWGIGSSGDPVISLPRTQSIEELEKFPWKRGRHGLGDDRKTSYSM